MRWPVLFSHRPAPAMSSSRWRRFSRARTSSYVGGARHSQRGCAELRLRRHDAVRARQVLRLRPHRRRHAAPMSASAIPAPTTMAGAPTRMFGQSYQLGGENSFASPDLVNVGAYSGLETDDLRLCRPCRLRTPERLLRLRSAAASTSRRFEIRRAEVKAGYSGLPVSLTRQICLHPGAAALWLHRRPPRSHARRLDAPGRKLARLRHRHLRPASKACWSRTASALPMTTSASPI